MTKVCTRCGLEKPATREHFSPRSAGMYGLQSRCRPCAAARLAEYRRETGYLAEWRARNREKLRASHSKWRADHPERMQANRDKWKADNPEGALAAQRRSLLRRYGISLEQYDQMLREQGGVCAVCDQPEKTMVWGKSISHLVVDHDHQTGEIRGLLCCACNLRVGRLEKGRKFPNEPRWVSGAREYLAA